MLQEVAINGALAAHVSALVIWLHLSECYHLEVRRAAYNSWHVCRRCASLVTAAEHQLAAPDAWQLVLVSMQVMPADIAYQVS